MFFLVKLNVNEEPPKPELNRSAKDLCRIFGDLDCAFTKLLVLYVPNTVLWLILCTIYGSFLMTKKTEIDHHEVVDTVDNVKCI